MPYLQKKNCISTQASITAALVRKSWIDGQPDEAGEKEFSPDKPLPNAYEDSVAYADQIADQLRRESDRAAQIQTLEAQLKGTVDTLREKKEEQRSLLENLSAFEERWRKVWEPLNIVPLSPQEMEEWLRAAKSLVQGCAELEREKGAADKLLQEIQSFHGELSRVLGGLGDSAGQPV